MSGRKPSRSLPARRLPSGEKGILPITFPAEQDRDPSGRAFGRESIALSWRKTEHAGRILSPQGQNPGQLSGELIRSSSRICPAPRWAPSFSDLEQSLAGHRPAGRIPVLLRPATTERGSIPFSNDNPLSPGRKTHRSTPPPRTLAVPAASSPAQLNLHMTTRTATPC